MSFFIQTLSNIFTAFKFLVLGDEKANAHIHISEPHWLLSWLMMVFASLIYLLYLPTAFSNELNQTLLPDGVVYEDYKFANLFSLIFVLLAGYLIIYVMAKLLECSGSVRRYIIAQNWVFMVSIIFLLPLSNLVSSEDSPLIGLMIFIFFFLLFFAFRNLKIILGLSSAKAFLLLVILFVFELTMDQAINSWFGLTKIVAI